MMKKVVVTLLAAVLLIGSTLTVNAAGLRDVFSAKYYADKYPDLKAAFGYDEEMLYQHFLDYGLKEGRNMSPILDVQLYREKYADLDAAFGDNWDAYVQHFFDYGINENRDNGTNFDVKTYIAAYDDIEEAFGNDFSAVVEHYLTFGMEENRTMGDPEVYQASQNPSEPSQGDGSGDNGGEGEDPGKVDYEPEYIYDENDRVIRVNWTYEGRTYYYDLYDYDEDGHLVKKTEYDASDDTVLFYTVIVYENGVKQTETYYRADGTVLYVKEFNADGSWTWTRTSGDYTTVEEYDTQSVIVKLTITHKDGYVTRISEYEDGMVVTNTYYAPDGSITMKDEYVTNDQGERVRRSYIYLGDGYSVSIYDAEGTKIGQETYDEDGNLTMILAIEYLENGYTKHIWKYGDGVVKSISLLNEKMQEIEITFYDADGNVTSVIYNTFDEDGNRIRLKQVDADGRYSILEYSTKGLLMKQSFYLEGDVLNSYVTWTYNEQDLATREDWFNKYGELQYYYLIIYDEDGNRIGEQQYDADTRDASYWLHENNEPVIEIEYDSTVIEYERDNDVVRFYPVDDGEQPFGYAAIKTGCNSYEEYKEYLVETISTERGVPEDSIEFLEYDNFTMNGFTYYALEWSYRTETDIDYDDVIYVKIAENKYVEVSDAFFYDLEELVKTAFYIACVD